MEFNFKNLRKKACKSITDQNIRNIIEANKINKTRREKENEIRILFTRYG